MKNNRQTHSVHIVFDGTAEELFQYLESLGVKLEVAVQGLVGSNSVVIIEKEDEQIQTR
ncbi:MAG: hypothetical protein HC840_10460 [Leptolyngbyaceae cyanobacterium RM2_2_4]|nr:hypothetical protein [Leptolyngbyaceae cyanobacterium RM2_2_4]